MLHALGAAVPPIPISMPTWIKVLVLNAVMSPDPLVLASFYKTVVSAAIGSHHPILSNVTESRAMSHFAPPVPVTEPARIPGVSLSRDQREAALMLAGVRVAEVALSLEKSALVDLAAVILTVSQILALLVEALLLAVVGTAEI